MNVEQVTVSITPILDERWLVQITCPTTGWQSTSVRYSLENAQWFAKFELLQKWASGRVTFTTPQQSVSIGDVIAILEEYRRASNAIEVTSPGLTASESKAWEREITDGERTYIMVE